MYKNFNQTIKKTSGFTLLEILLVVAAIGILAGVVVIAINPAKQLAEARNAQRRADVEALLEAVYQYSIDNNGNFPAGIDTQIRMMGTAADNCDVSCGEVQGTSGFFSDNNQSSFDEGIYYQLPPADPETQYDSLNNWVELSTLGKGNGYGRYASGIKDATGASLWSTLTWIPSRPNYKELPNNRGIESGYLNGDMDMSGNMLLLHMNEITDGTCSTGDDVCDTSSNNYHGWRTGATLGATGKLNTGISFDGNDALNFGNVLNPGTSDWTFCTWFMWDGTTTDRIISNKENLYEARVLNGYVQYAWQPHWAWDGGTSFPVTAGAWYHMCVKYDHVRQYLYRNGVEVYRRNQTGDIGTNTNPFCIGARNASCNSTPYTGILDEFAVFNYALSDTEIQNIYLRGALKTTIKVRSCAEADCATAGNFTGAYTELTNTGLTPPPSITLSVPENQYFQYQTTFETSDSSYSPELTSVTMNYAVNGIEGEMTDTACLDLINDLTPKYIVDIPIDPSEGEAARTQYSVKKTANGRIAIKACSVENEEQISVTR
ncbi:MAG: LamG-like jellyroll fold domain-containing protein [bacterium]